MPRTRHKRPGRHNKFEVQTRSQLEINEISFEYEAEKLAYVIEGVYKSDFTIRSRNGKIVMETKGFFRPEDKRKMVAVRKAHPDLDLRILFYSYRPEYIRWAEKYNIKWAVKRIPAEWIEDFK